MPEPPRCTADTGLLDEVVDLWHLDLSGPPPAPDGLAPDERDRLQRLRVPAKRVQFAAARSQLRRVLAGYLDAAPGDLRFEYQEHGKPCLRDHRDLEFNLSHSGSAALLAVTRGTPVGVDIEHARPGRRFEAIARRFFAAAEHAALLDLAPDRRADGFYRAWAAKEAYLKAWGTGLSFPSNRFTIAYAGQPLRLVATEMPTDRPDQWQLVPVATAPDYRAALCYRGETRWLRHFTQSRGCSTAALR